MPERHWCYLGATIVTTPRGPKSMDEMAVGDKVLIARANGALEHEHVLFCSFKNNHKALFTIITTDDGAAVSATPFHYLAVSQ
ncbi:hypothetical protein WJX77_007275 [Trebouxia sp. C0004]